MRYESVTVSGIEYRPYDKTYAVSKCGLALKRLSPFIPRTAPNGYAYIGKRLVHRMVATVWIRPPKDGEHIHHINHNKLDNRASNLEWISPKEHFGDRHKDNLKRFSKTKPTEAHKEKLRQLRLGSTMSKETRLKIGRSLKEIGHKPAPRYGKRSAEELERRKKNPPNATPCIIDGVRYISFAEAGAALGIRPLTLRKRCHSPNFPNSMLE